MPAPPYSPEQRKKILNALRALCGGSQAFNHIPGRRISFETAVRLVKERGIPIRPDPDSVPWFIFEEQIEPAALSFTDALSNKAKISEHLRTIRNAESRLKRVADKCAELANGLYRLDQEIGHLTSFEGVIIAFKYGLSVSDDLRKLRGDAVDLAERLKFIENVTATAAELAKQPKLYPDYNYEDLFTSLIAAGQEAAREGDGGKANWEPTYRGAWIDCLFCCISPLRPQTTRASIKSKLERWRREQRSWSERHGN
jgi:hypothetical protein